MLTGLPPLRRLQRAVFERSSAVASPHLIVPDLPSASITTASKPAPLSDVRRTFVRPNGKQENIVSIDPRAQLHAVLESYDVPAKRMVLLAQPSGNVGAGLWWSSSSITALTAPDAPEVVDEGGLSGSRLRIVADQPGTLELGVPLLDTVRAHRDVQFGVETSRADLREEARRLGIEVPEAAVRARVIERSPERVVFERTTISGHHRHRLEVVAGAGTTLDVDASGGLVATSKGAPDLALTYLTDLPPLTPIAPLELLRPEVRRALERDVALAEVGHIGGGAREQIRAVTRALEDLSSMVFREKAIAGGFRFLTYFGRDTLQTVRMLRPLLDPSVVKSVLGAALDRVSPDGVVAHEEDIADQAEHVRLQAALRGEPTPPVGEWDAPILDTKMIDDDFMLVSAVAEYLSDPALTDADKTAFLAEHHTSLSRVVRYAVERATPFANAPSDPTKLVALPEGEPVGDWRDSHAGLAGGRYPSSVNLELVPTTLEKALTLGETMERLGFDAPAAPDTLSAMAAAWKSARRHFEVKIGPDEIAARLRTFLLERCTPEERRYFSQIDVGEGITAGEVAFGRATPTFLEEGWRFSAVALDADARPIPVMSSDGVFGLVGSSARREGTSEYTRLATTPFPLGLASEAGVLISNPVLSDDSAHWDLIGPGRYHGAVVWSWLEALGIAACAHQAGVLEAAGDHSTAEAARRAARSILAQSEGAGPLQTAELYGWAVEGSKLAAVPFSGGEHENDECWPGNATQLWATALPLLAWSRCRFGDQSTS